MGRSRPPPGSTRGSHPDPFPRLPPPAVPEQRHANNPKVISCLSVRSPGTLITAGQNQNHLPAHEFGKQSEGTISELPRTRSNAAPGNILKINVQLCKPNLHSLGREAPRGRGQELRSGLPVAGTSRSYRFQPRHAPTPPPRSVT